MQADRCSLDVSLAIDLASSSITLVCEAGSDLSLFAGVFCHFVNAVAFRRYRCRVVRIAEVYVEFSGIVLH